MKILKLRFKNLNSLAGEWEIDFSSPHYVSEGIFAITGSTGAGKSTILDAICLGLYGKTPRLTNISASTNEIMSRKTGSCFAEVVFESQKGVFRTCWSQKRARENANGRLQTPQFELADEMTGKVIESQLSKTTKAIEERTGMDFGRFTQAMMLAQGSFAAFLQASEHDRASMLEDITGTEIYSELSKLAFERNKTEKDTLRELQLKAEGVKTLTVEEIFIFEKEIEEKFDAIQLINNQKKVVDISLLWLKQIAELTANLRQLQIDKNTNDDAIIAFTPQQKRLTNALKAAELEAEFVNLEANRKTIKTLNDSILSVEQNLPLLKNKCVEFENILKRKHQEQEATTKTCETERTLLKDVREMDILIVEKRNTVNKIIANANDAIEQKKGYEKQIKTIVQWIEQANTQLQASSEYLEQHKADESLQSEAPVLNSEIVNIAENTKKLQNLQQDIEILTKNKLNSEEKSKEIAQKINIFEIQKKEFEATIINYQKLNTELLANRNTDDYRRELTLLNENLLLQQKIESYEQERLHLQDGKACPLCGSEHHPFAQGNIPLGNAIKDRIVAINFLFEKLEKIESEKRNVETAFQRKSAELTNTQAELKIAQNEFANFESNLFQKITEHNNLNTITENLSKALIISLAKYAFGDVSNWEQVSQQLTSRSAEWKKHNETKTSIDAEIRKLESEQNTQKALFEEVEKRANKLSFDANIENEAFKVVYNKRTELFGTKNTDSEELLLDAKLKLAADAVNEAQNLYLQADNIFKNNEQKLGELKNALADIKPNLVMLEAQFINKLSENKFVNENDYCAAILPLNERNNLRQQAELLVKQETGVRAKLDDTKKKLDLETTKNLTDKPAHELQMQTNTLANETNTMTERIGAIRNELLADKNNREQHATLLNLIEAQKAEQQKWAQLDSYIGSADGQKFRRFAQGLTFEVMVRFANQQLTKLTDRYILMRSPESPLSLTVIDQYQAGEQRTTKNLSGGESFLVSLSLALGLSQMASKNVRIDSLFLDEGFGTLDEETLETALNALASMQQDGKLIGVISHISQLKERINTKIVVEKNNNGRSSLSGPGCQKLTY